MTLEEALADIAAKCREYSLCAEDLLACIPGAGEQDTELLSRAHEMWETDELNLLDKNVSSEADDAVWLLAWVRVPNKSESVEEEDPDGVEN